MARLITKGATRSCIDFIVDIWILVGWDAKTRRPALASRERGESSEEDVTTKAQNCYKEVNSILVLALRKTSRVSCRDWRNRLLVIENNRDA
jgi:hypothetical protein